MGKEFERPEERMKRDEEYTGEITHGKLAQTLGRAMVDTDFQEELLGDAEGVGKELGLNESAIAVLKSIDRELFDVFAKMLGSKLLKDAAAVIFCAV